MKKELDPTPIFNLDVILFLLEGKSLIENHSTLLISFLVRG